MNGQLSLDDFNSPRGLTRSELMTAREVAELLDVPVSTVREWGRNGTLPQVKLGRHVRFIRQHVEAAIFHAENGRVHLLNSESPTALRRSAESGMLGVSTRLLTVQEAADEARCSTRTVRRAVSSGRLRGYQPSGPRGRVLIACDDVEDWIFGDCDDDRRLPSPRAVHVGAAGLEPIVFSELRR